MVGPLSEERVQVAAFFDRYCQQSPYRPVPVKHGNLLDTRRGGLASGGIIPLVIAIAVLAFVINLTINKLIK